MEQTRKTNKKKLVIALALLALIVVASVITTVVLVLAAGQQGVNSNVNVTYTVTDVSATVSAKYGRVGAENLTEMTIGGAALAQDKSNATYTFLPQEAPNTSSPLALQPQNVKATDNPDFPYPDGVIALESGKPYAIFEYAFTNNSDEKAFSIVLTYTDDFDADSKNTKDTNVLIGYTFSETALDATDYNAATQNADGDAIVVDSNELTPLVSKTATTADITCAETMYVYVFVMVDDLNAGAGFSGTFAFSLTAVDMPTV